MSPSLSVYTMPHCGACISLKEWLNRENIDFTEKDIINNDQFKQEFVEKQLMYTPHTIIEVASTQFEIVGFNPEKISRILDIFNNE